MVYRRVTEVSVVHNVSRILAGTSTVVVVPGSLRQRGPNVWQIRVSAGRDPATGRYRYVSRTVEGGKRAAQRR